MFRFSGSNGIVWAKIYSFRCPCEKKLRVQSEGYLDTDLLVVEVAQLAVGIDKR